MRIDSLNLKAYGSFDGTVIDFPGDAGLHIIYGDNEAGKSTALRALSDLLFGFPHTTTADFLHGTSALRVGAQLTSSRGEILDIVRRKGRGLTLRDASGNEVDDAVLTPFIGKANREFFETMFGLDHERLRKGGQNLLEEKGDVGMGLFEAGTGIVNLREALRTLDTEIDQLFKPRAGKPLINAAIEAHQEARKDEKRARLSGDAWKEAHKRHASLEQEIDHTREAIRDNQAQQSRLRRLQRSLPLLARRNALQAESNALVEVPDLPEDASSQRVDAQNLLGVATEAHRIAEKEIERLTAERGSLTVSPDLVAAAGDIATLRDDAGATAKADKDRPNRNAELRQRTQQISDLLAELGWDVPVEKAKGRLPSRVRVATVRSLLSQHTGLVARAASIEASQKESERLLARHTRDLGALAASRDVSALFDEVRAAQAEGAVEERGRQKQAELDRVSATVSEDLKSLRMFTGSLDDLASLPVLLEATVDRFTARFNELQAERKRLEERLREATDEVLRIDNELARLNAESQVPTRAVLDEARDLRERGWRLVRRAYIDGHDDIQAEVVAYDAARSLPDAYEHHVSESDRIADQMHAEAQRVAEQAALIAGREQAVKKRAHECEALETVSALLASLQGEWCETWRTCGFEPLSPAEMLAWLRQRATLVQRRETLVAARVEAAQLHDLVKRLSGRLSKALEAVGEPGAGPDERLTAIVERASARVRHEDELRRSRANLEKRIEEQNEKGAEIVGQREALDADRGKWETEWQAALVDVGLDGGASASVVEASLAILADLDKLVPSFEDLRRRITRIDEDRASFEGRVKGLVAALAPDLSERPDIEAVKALSERFEQAKRVDDRVKTIADELARHERSVDEASAKMRRHQTELVRLCAQAGCETADQLEPIEASAAKKRSVAAQLRNVENDLLDGGAGLSLEQLAQEAEGVSGDTVGSTLDEVESALKDLGAKRETLAHDMGSAKAELDAMNGGDEAAHHQQLAEQALTRIKGGAQRYVRLVVARLQLLRAIERHRMRSQGPIVELATGFFRRLTGEAFSGLEVDYDESDRRVLLGKRPDGKLIGVDGMSTGTRDQLFLSLRLAAIEHYIERSEALPVIADDLLTDFDDDRASQALELLSEVSAKVQVVFFTHHTHLLRLAEACLDPVRYSVRRL